MSIISHYAHTLDIHFVPRRRSSDLQSLARAAGAVLFGALAAGTSLRPAFAVFAVVMLVSVLAGTRVK
ncbi:hypothetical protein CFP71_43220 [Amycolatopsis thailandensis]|uniref:Uncharacterized protein n=1 Tax=Amycolatopsis thailandensis TaxID=589330 RepID=A0A229QY87_9PSEU|nr:hypothetical protein CFP71_43220 [Amycolatopsis thailandensis]